MRRICTVMFALVFLGPVAAADVVLTRIASGLDQPVAIASTPHDERLFVAEQPGRIIALRPDGSRSIILDIRSRVRCCGERGLLGVAIDPAENPPAHVYVNYTESPAGSTRISRFDFDPGSGTAAPSTESILLTFSQPFSNHNGGQIAFGPDGHLWIATGDGGSGGDPMGNGQRLDTLLGKILRISPTPNGGYSIPPDNPFVGTAARAEIWALGLRNPWRFSFDRLTGDFYAGDVGQNRFEEIDFEPAGSAGGLNYGWNRKEGFACFSPSSGCSSAGLTDPILAYGRDGGCAVTAGYVYRGARVPELFGRFVYGDFCSGRIWAAQRNGSEWTTEMQFDTQFGISAFGEDRDGEIYFADLIGGAVYRFDAPSTRRRAVRRR